MADGIVLRPFQNEGVDFLIHTRRAILGDDMGVGKTAQAVFASLRANTPRVLIVCPKAARWVWAEHIARCAPATARTIIVSGTPTERTRALTTPATFYIINYDLFRIHQEQISTSFRAMGLTVIFDEAHKLKNRKTKIFKAAKAIAPRASFLFLLSGTPILNRASESWTLLNLLDPRAFGSYWKFVQAYCQLQYNGFGYTVLDVLNPTDYRIVILRRALKRYMIRRTKAEVLPQLPSKTVQQVWVDLSPEHKRVYAAMEEKMLVYLLTGEKVEAVTVLSLITRLKQISVDPSTMVDVDAIHPLEGEKMDALRDIVEGLGDKKLVVFSQFARVIKKAAITLQHDKVTTATFCGTNSDRVNQENLKSFRTASGPQVLLVTIQSGGQALDFTVASTAVFMDKYWTPKINEQAQDRLHRFGQQEPVTIIELLSKDTVEERIEILLKKKSYVFDSIVEGSVRDEALTTHLIAEYRELARALQKGGKLLRK